VRRTLEVTLVEAPVHLRGRKRPEFGAAFDRSECVRLVSACSVLLPSMADVSVARSDSASGSNRGFHYCHCDMCRRATGSAFAVLAWVSTRSLTWAAAEPSYRQVVTISPERVCSDCGSPLSLAYDASPVRFALHVGTFDDPARSSLHTTMERSSGLAGVCCGIDLPHHRRRRNAGEAKVSGACYCPENSSSSMRRPSSYLAPTLRPCLDCADVVLQIGAFYRERRRIRCSPPDESENTPHRAARHCIDRAQAIVGPSPLLRAVARVQPSPFSMRSWR